MGSVVLLPKVDGMPHRIPRSGILLRSNPTLITNETEAHQNPFSDAELSSRRFKAKRALEER